MTTQTMQKTRILVVDDDLRLRDLLQRYLGEKGFAVTTVSDPNGMDRLLGRERFELMVLDLMLPGEDGLSICRRLRGTKNTIPIIMLTAKGEDVDRILGLEMGAGLRNSNQILYGPLKTHLHPVQLLRLRRAGG